MDRPALLRLLSLFRPGCLCALRLFGRAHDVGCPVHGLRAEIGR